MKLNGLPLLSATTVKNTVWLEASYVRGTAPEGKADEVVVVVVFVVGGILLVIVCVVTPTVVGGSVVVVVVVVEDLVAM